MVSCSDHVTDMILASTGIYLYITPDGAAPYLRDGSGRLPPKV